MIHLFHLKDLHHPNFQQQYSKILFFLNQLACWREDMTAGGPDQPNHGSIVVEPMSVKLLKMH